MKRSSEPGLSRDKQDLSLVDKKSSAIIKFGQMHKLLMRESSTGKVSQDSVVAVADNLAVEMSEVADRRGINAGNPDGTKHVKFIDATGNFWLAKDYPVERRHRALADEFVSGLSAKMGLDTTMEAKPGVFQGSLAIFVKWEDTVGSLWDDLSEANWEVSEVAAGLNETELKQIATEQVLDWLVSNHDSHLGHFLRRATGGFLCIDKAQAFKYLGSADEKLSITYNPNGPYNGFNNISYIPIYNLILPKVAIGQTAVSLKDLWSVVNEKIKIIEDISDKEYLEALRPYANFRFGVINSLEDQKTGLTVERFLELALDRKRKLRQDFVEFYEKLKALA